MRLLCLLVLFLAVSGTASYAASIGVSPSRLEYSDVLKGGYAEKQFTVSTSSEDVLFGHFELSGNIREWVSFRGNSSAFNATSSSPAVTTLIITPPADAPAGTYSGKVIVVADETATLSGRAGSIVKTAIELAVRVDITGDEIKSCKAGAFQFQDVEIGKPLELWLTLENNGNVRTSPLVTFDLFDNLRESLITTQELQSPVVMPTQTRRFFLQSPNTLGTGQYWVVIGVPECSAESLVTFSVLEKGEIANNGELVELRAKPEADLFETVPVTASFINRGIRLVTAQFKATVALGNKVVKVIESDKITVQPGENALLEAFFVPEEPGRYQVTGKVVYNEKLTFEKGISINVTGEEPERELPLALIAYVVSVVSAFFVLRWLRKRKARFR